MIYRFAQFELDEDERELRRDGKPVVLQPLIFDLLALLVRNHRRVVSKGEFMETLWPDVTVTEASLQRAVSVARSALRDEEHSLVRTFSGHGYRFSGDVHVSNQTEESVAAPEEARQLMPRPHIQYAKTSDGVSIAFWTLGEGLPLVLTPPLNFSHISLEWKIDRLRHWYERLASRRMLVRFDWRGMGISEREVEDHSLDAFVSDFEAVTDHLGLEGFDLLAFYSGARVAIPYVARHPGRVSRLVLWEPLIRSADTFAEAERLTAIMALGKRDWELATETIAHGQIGWSKGPQAQQWARFIRASISQDDWLRRCQVYAFDVSPLLSQISAQTLVLEEPSKRELPHHGTLIASHAPHAHLIQLGASSVSAYEHEEGMRLVDHFLGIEAD